MKSKGDGRAGQRAAEAGENAALLREAQARIDRGGPFGILVGGRRHEVASAKLGVNPGKLPELHNGNVDLMIPDYGPSDQFTLSVPAQDFLDQNP